MEFVIEQPVFNQALIPIGDLIKDKTPSPVIQNVLIQVGEGNFRLSATDFVSDLFITIPADVREAGEISVPAKLLAQWVGSLGATADIKVKMGASRLSLSAGKSKSTLATIPAKDFPQRPAAEINAVLVLTAGELRTAISQTVFATTNDPLRTIVNSVYFDCSVSPAVMVGSNGQRMSVKNLSVNALQEKTFLIPREPLMKLEKILRKSKADDQVTIHMDANKRVIFDVGNGVVLATLQSEGMYFTYSVATTGLPEVCRALAPTSDLRQAAKRIRLFSEGEYSFIKLTTDGKYLNLSTVEQSNEMGNGSDEIAIEIESGEIDSVYSGIYLLDALDHMENDKVILVGLASGTSESGKNITFLSLRDGENGFTHTFAPQSI